jgi:hypothetical protein
MAQLSSTEDFPMTRAEQLQKRIRGLVWLFIVALLISGLTAIPLEWELEVARKLVGADGVSPDSVKSGLAFWLTRVHESIKATNAQYPFLAYGTDWLAFGHVVIALAFVGALRDPVRNIWLFEFGMIACVLVIPWAFVFGAVRGIPVYWRLIDCSFGVFGFVPLWFGYQWTWELATLQAGQGRAA